MVGKRVTSGKYWIIVVVLSWQCCVFAQTQYVYVDQNAIPPGGGIKVFPYPTFKVGAADVQPGGTVSISPGSYDGVGTYSKAMTLVAPSGGVVLGGRRLPWENFGCIASGVDEDQDFIDDELEKCMASFYHPTLILHEGEKGVFWPSSAEWFVRNSALELFLDYPGCCFSTSRYTLRSPGGLADSSWLDLKSEIGIDSERITISVTYPTPTNVRHITRLPDGKNLPSPLDATVWYALNPPGSYTRQGVAPEDTKASPVPVYTHVFPNDFGGINIQYWYFFPYNGTEREHEGDWEHINLILKEDLDIHGAWYFAHGHPAWVDRQDLELVSKNAICYDDGFCQIAQMAQLPVDRQALERVARNSVHPKVYLAEESHASYASDAACDSGGFLHSDDCRESLAVWWWPSSINPWWESGLINPLYWGTLLDLGEKGFESFAWERFGGRWGVDNPANPLAGHSNSPVGPLFQDSWLQDAALHMRFLYSKLSLRSALNSWTRSP